MNAGWEGLFAVEYEPNAFKTLSKNLLEGKQGYPRYRWPAWLPREHMDIASFRQTYKRQLQRMKDNVDLIAGGPPCQGFSFAGRRRRDDHRNLLIQDYLAVVGLVQPKFLLIENVEGIAVGFRKMRGFRQRDLPLETSVADQIREELDKMGYRVFSGVVRAADAGVPQTRPRFIMIGIQKKLAASYNWQGGDPFQHLQGLRELFLLEKGLPNDRDITAEEALSDLETTGQKLIECTDSDVRGFRQACYSGPTTDYQRLMHGDMGGASPNSMRLANHRPETRKRYALALEIARRGVNLTRDEKHQLGIMKKHQFKVMDRDRPSHTLTTLPDDLIHYKEPRILTVREYARLQSFPDWFEFHGKYTTGGELRVKQAPRYTQVGNAVAPLVAELLGELLRGYYDELVQVPARQDAASRQHQQPALA